MKIVESNCYTYARNNNISGYFPICHETDINKLEKLFNELLNSKRNEYLLGNAPNSPPLFPDGTVLSNDQERNNYKEFMENRNEKVEKLMQEYKEQYKIVKILFEIDE